MILSLLACHGSPDHPGKDHHPPVEPTFAELAEDGGYVVTDGRFETVDYEGCCAPDASCLWNNPSTPYGVYVLPPSSTQTGTTDAGTLQQFHLRGDEALVYLGQTPPESRYFSWRSYLTYRSVHGVPTAVFGSLGPSLNDLVIRDRQGADAVFAQPIAIVTTADAAVERTVEEWLVQTGWDRTHIYADQLPYKILRMGTDPEDDTFSVVSRAAVFADSAAADAWHADAGATVLRLTPTAPEAPPVEPYKAQPLPAMGSGTNEDGWKDAVDRLQAAIEARYPALVPAVVTSNDWFFETYTCLLDNYCSGEIRDRYYARVPSLTVPADGTLVVAFGVNHERTGKASYANMSVETVENRIGLVAVESDRFVGSARAFVPDDPQVDDLYAVLVTRDCGPYAETAPGVPCLDVPETCPGVPLADPLVIDFRAYLEPTTGAAPLGTELLHDRVVKLFVAPL